MLAESCLLTVLGGALGLGLAWLVISRGDPTGGLLPLFFFPTRDLLIGLGHQHRAGFRHWNFSRAPGHAPARGGCLEENDKFIRPGRVAIEMA